LYTEDSQFTLKSLEKCVFDKKNNFE